MTKNQERTVPFYACKHGVPGGCKLDLPEYRTERTEMVEMIGLLRDQLQFHISGYAISKADEGRSHSLCNRAQELLVKFK